MPHREASSKIPKSPSVEREILRKKFAIAVALVSTRSFFNRTASRGAVLGEAVGRSPETLSRYGKKALE
jgi:hypothetical protein